jgi:predicted nucleotide-binding protein (sugar kinase/HSP70/actin superfamily)
LLFALVERAFGIWNPGENKPSGSIRIRVETVDYFLWRYREDVIKKARRRN